MSGARLSSCVLRSANAVRAPGDTPVSVQGKSFGSLFATGRTNLGFLRFFLATSVIFFHSFPLTGKGIEPLSFLTRGQVTLGNAVNSFFVLSGFLVTHSWGNSSGFVDYLKKRVLRIYPAFIVVAILDLFLFGLMGAENRADYLRRFIPVDMLLSLVFLKGYWLHGSFLHNQMPEVVNGSLWSIPYEFRCYLLLALLGTLGLFGKRRLLLALFLCCLAFYGTAENLSLHLHWKPSFRLSPWLMDNDLNLWPRLATYYLAGVLFYLYRDRIPHALPLLLLSLAALVVSVFIRGLFPVTLPTFGSYVLFYVAFAQSLRLSDVGKKRDLSYGIYLYAFPLQQLAILYSGGSLGPYGLFAVAMPLTCLAALMSWHLVERPFLRLKRPSPLPPGFGVGLT